MALILRSGYDFYNHLFTNLKDPRNANYFLLKDSPAPVVSILAAYIFLCKFGPILMENRKPFELRSIMTVYNFIQVVANTLCGFFAIYYLFIKYEFNFYCQPINFSNDEHGTTQMNLTWIYFMLKLLDLLDTVFIVLKKKNSQLTFLHCYHHSGMFFGAYCAAKWVCGGSLAILGVVNAFVHSVMYFYYWITAFKPELKQSLWWKKHITQIQLLQFSILAVHFLSAAFAENCGFPRVVSWVLVIQNTFMLTLFGDFYVKAYLKGSKKEN